MKSFLCILGTLLCLFCLVSCGPEPPKELPIRCRTNGLWGMPNYGGAGRTVYVKNNSDVTLKIHVEQDGAYGAFGFTMTDATGDYTISPGGEIHFDSEVNRTLTITADGYEPCEYRVSYQ